MSCPICDKDSDQKYKPFCSRCCADVDLGKWMNDHYLLAGESVEIDVESFQDTENSVHRLH